MNIEETTKGPLGAFVHFVPFKSLLAYAGQRAVLLSAPQHDEQVRELNFLQYAHFTRIPAKALKRAGIPVDSALKYGAMLFSSAFNGNTTVYFRAFSDHVATPLTALWGGSVGWTAAQPYPELDQFIKRYRRTVAAYFHGFPLSLLEIRRALELRSGLERLAEIARSNPEAFDREYEALAMAHWGNGKLEVNS